LGDKVGAVLQRNLSETSGTQLTTCPSTPRWSHESPRTLTISSTIQMERELMNGIFELVSDLYRESQVFQQTKTWLQQLVLDRNKNLLAAAHKWFVDNSAIIADLQKQKHVEKFVQDLDMYFKGMERNRVLDDGATVAAGIGLGPAPELTRRVMQQDLSEVHEFVLEIRGKTPQENDYDLQAKIEQAVRDRYGEVVTFVKFGSIVLRGPEKVFQSFQAELNMGCPVQIADFSVIGISRGYSMSISLPIPLREVLINLHECRRLQTALNESNATDKAKTLYESGIHKQEEEMPYRNEVTDQMAAAIDCQRIEKKEKETTACATTEQAHRSQIFTSAVLEGQAQTGYLRRFCALSLPCLVSFEVPDFIIDNLLTIRQLGQDHHGWLKVSGSDASCIAVEHLSRDNLQLEIRTFEDYNLLQAALEWASSIHARMHRKVTISGVSIPQNYMVSLQDLEQCSGQKLMHSNDGKLMAEALGERSKFRPQSVTFFLPRYDVCPNAQTTFMPGDRAYFGCREKSFRWIPVVDEEDVQSLRRHLDEDNVVTCELTLKSVVGSEESTMKLIPGFKLLGCEHADNLVLGPDTLVPGANAVFEVSPREILRFNFQGLSPQDHHRFDIDYFRVANLKEPCCLGDLHCPLNRASSRLNIVGIARQITQDDGTVVFSVDWFPGRESGVSNGDLVLLPRVPAETAMGAWGQFWHDADVESFADANPDFDGNLCQICHNNRKNCLLMPCGHVLCGHCAARRPKTCPFCRSAIERAITIYYS